MTSTDPTAPTMGPFTLIARTEEWIEVSRRWPLWTAIPARYRCTEQTVHDSGHLKAPYYLEKELEALRNPACVAATRQAIYHNLWFPCRRTVRAGHDLCPCHGGPTVRADPDGRTAAQLKREVDELRAQLDRLLTQPEQDTS